MEKDDFHLSALRYWRARLIFSVLFLWRWCGNIESTVLSDRLEDIDVESPVYISGLARTGSTILLRVLASANSTVSHQYRDFPFLFTPYWLQRFFDFLPNDEVEAVERAHKDRLKVRPSSPESREETLWMAFFDDLHNPDKLNILDETTENEEFESFYRDHIRKLLLARGGSRYVSKANYNISRFRYLLELFPDAKFVVPVRHPVHFAASSMKQHRLFESFCEEQPRVAEYLKYTGHLEFGPNRTPICVDESATDEILELWENEEQARGWAKYWATVYEYLLQEVRNGGKLEESVLFVRYERLCDATRQQLKKLFSFCGLEEGQTELLDGFEDEISRPDYYDSGFDEETTDAIWAEAESVACEFGYGSDGAVDETFLA